MQISRSPALGILLSAVLTLATQAQSPVVRDELKVLPPLIDGATPDALVETQLKQRAFAALDRRDTAYEQLQTPEQLAAWQQRQRENFLAALGGFPEPRRRRRGARWISAT